MAGEFFTTTDVEETSGNIATTEAVIKFQVSGMAGCSVEILGKLVDAAPLEIIDVIRDLNRPFSHVASLPIMAVRVRRNTAGNEVGVWFVE